MNPIAYPDHPSERDAWIMARRPDWNAIRRALPVDRAVNWLIESEPDDQGVEVGVLTIFLTNRECPWRCLMCDLWRHTTLQSVPPGAMPDQIRHALNGLAERRRADLTLPEPRWLKLYNAGSFFDAGAISPADHPAIAALAASFERVIVECHPNLVGDRVPAFQRRLGTIQLEVALGLETADPEVLNRLNKRMTPVDFVRAAKFLRDHGVAVRAFILVKPPFLDEAAALDGARRSVDFAFAAGVQVISLIPTRTGNGALEELAQAGQFSPPRLDTLESVFDYAVSQRRGRVFVDQWDLERLAVGEPLFAERRARLAAMNRQQRVLPRVTTDNSSPNRR